MLQSTNRILISSLATASRILLGALLITLSSCHFITYLSAAERVVISVIFSSDAQPYKETFYGFKELIKEQKTHFSYSEYNLQKTEPEMVCSDILGESPDVVLSIGTKASKLAKEKIKDIPVVFTMVLNEKEIVGTNITGTSVNIPDETKLKKISKILPGAKKIAVVYSDETAPVYKQMLQCSEAMGFQLVSRKVNLPKEFPGVVADLFKQADCFLMIPDSKVYFPQSVEYLLLEGLRNKIPVIGISSVYTKAGALMSFDCDYRALGMQTAGIVLKILNGEKPANLSPEGPEKIKLSLNLVVSERLGIKIPQDIIRQATVFGEQ